MKKILFFIIFILLVSNVTATTISFFEEFPDHNTLKRVEKIDFETRIYLAAKNLSEFYSLEEKYKRKNTEMVYWPILEKEEGYWISPWANENALKRIFEEVKGRDNHKKLKILLDLEPPIQRWGIFDFRGFSKKKNYIADFIKDGGDYNVSVLTVEKSYIPDFVLEMFGLSFDSGNRKIKMYYTSYRRRFMPNFLVNKLFEWKVRKYKDEGIVLGIGLIAPGVHDAGHKISPTEFQRELEIASKYELDEVIIFRLEGFNEEYSMAVDKVKNIK